MKTSIISTIYVFVMSIVILVSCNKEKFTPVDVKELYSDSLVLNTALDKWLTETFLEPYNSRVYYRYNAYFHDADRNVSPPDPLTVKPMMTAVLEGFINPYKKIAGQTFIKKMIPKEWILFGSYSYDGGGTGYAGDASGGIRVRLYGLNHMTNSQLAGQINTIHHEFTHIINQLVPIPPDFVTITGSTYKANWKDTKLEDAHKWGYVSSYASQNPAEDYAEMVSALLVSGQNWFNYWVKTSSSDEGKKALRAKEQNVVNYFNALGIDFRALQREVQFYLRDSLRNTQVLSFGNWLSKGLYSINVNLNDAMYTSHPVSLNFANAYNDFKSALYSKYDGFTLNMDDLQIIFTSGTTAVVRVNITNQDYGYTHAPLDYNFSVSVNATTGQTTFTKAAQGSGEAYDRAGWYEDEFANTIQAYLTSRTFIADWYPFGGATSALPETAGFYKKEDMSDSFYGKIIINK